MKKIIVNSNMVGKRIDKILSEEEELSSRGTVQRLIDEEKILVNNKKIKPSYKLQENDEITIEAEEAKIAELEPQEIPLDIIYEDKDIIVINKPKGMVVQPRETEIQMEHLQMPLWQNAKEVYLELVEK